MSDTTLETRSVDVVDASGAKSGSAELPAELFDITANIPLIHQVVTAQLAAARQGTHSTKRRGEVSGGGRKPYRQKGTGRARQGSTRAPQFTGGGIVHGPKPRDYAQRTPKKMVAAALRGALSDRARGGRVRVVSELISGDTPSTKAVVTALTKVSGDASVLVVLHRDEDVTWLSLRNVASVHALAVDQLNAYDVLVNDEIIFTEAALQAFVGRSTGATAVAAEEQPYGEGSYVGEEPPAGYTIKGNEDSKKFHTTESSHYERTIAEVWFNSVAAAQAAGFTATQGDTGAEEKS